MLYVHYILVLVYHARWLVKLLAGAVLIFADNSSQNGLETEGVSAGTRKGLSCSVCRSERCNAFATQPALYQFRTTYEMLRARNGAVLVPSLANVLWRFRVVLDLL